MAKFGPLAAEIVSLVWGTPANLNGFRVLVGLRASGNLPVSYVLTGNLPVTYHQQKTGNLPEIYHIVYFLVISKHIGGDTGAKAYN